MSALSNASTDEVPEPPPGYEFNDGEHVRWAEVFANLNTEQDRTVLGWVRVQRRVTDAARLRKWEIAQRLDVSSNLLEVRYEPSRVGSESWNEHKVNEFQADRVRRKIRQQKKRLAEKWGWDTWVRWTPPTTLTREQVLKVENVQTLREKNAAYAAEDYYERVKPREDIGEKLRAMDSWAREIYHLEDGVENLPPHLRERDERRATLLKRVRLIAHRKNQRMGQDGWREWRISITREMAERGKKKLALSDQTV